MPEAKRRQRVNNASLARIDEMNRTSGFVIISPGEGYEPEDLAEAGPDVTRTYLRGGLGSSTGILGFPKSVMGWTLDIVAEAVAAGVAKWLGWA